MNPPPTECPLRWLPPPASSDDFHHALAFRGRVKVLGLRGVQREDTIRQTGGSEPARGLSTRTTPQRHAGVLQEHLPAG